MISPDEICVLMTVYKADNAQHFRQALESIIVHQTQKPGHIVLVYDGHVDAGIETEMESVKQIASCNFIVVRNIENRGLACALNTGVDHLPEGAKYIVRHDADDISRPERISQQIDYLQKYPSVGIVSANVAIFEGEPSNVVGSRRLPTSAEELKRFGRYRTPITHSCCIIRRELFETCHYPETRLPFEDWWLCLRAVKNDWQLGSIPTVLMDVRGGQDMIKRRHGVAYASQELKFLLAVCHERCLTISSLFINILMRTPVRLVPVRILVWLYKKNMHS